MDGNYAETRVLAASHHGQIISRLSPSYSHGIKVFHSLTTQKCWYTWLFRQDRGVAIGSFVSSAAEYRKSNDSRCSSACSNGSTSSGNGSRGVAAVVTVVGSGEGCENSGNIQHGVKR